MLGWEFSMDSRRLPLFLCAVSLCAGSACAQSRQPTVQLEVPVDCEIGADCLIQKYVDMDGTSGRADHRCGLITTDGHDGIDFRLRTKADMARGVRVLAAASGRVLRIRDGVPDVSVKILGDTGGRDAGNAVIIAHEDGSETQYSHLRRNSVVVKPGESVKVGQTIGMVGMSGNAEFPHLHFSIRKGGEEIDPFTRRKVGEGCAPATSASEGLWSASAFSRLAYRDMAIVSAGVSSTVPSASTGDRAENAKAILSPGDALILWAEAIGAKPGDRQTFRVIGPGSETILEKVNMVERGGLSWFAYSGRRPPPDGWAKGQYRGEYSLSRAGSATLTMAVQFSVQ